MSLSQTIIASLFQITNNERYGFYFGHEPALIEKIIEAAELPFNSDSYTAVKSHLPGLTPALKKIGVEITRSGDYLTVWGPGVRHG